MPRQSKSSSDEKKGEEKEGAQAEPREEKEEQKPDAKKGAKPALKTRGAVEPLTVLQYEFLLKFVRWRFPRPPEKRKKDEHVPPHLLAEAEKLFRSKRNFSSTCCCLCSLLRIVVIVCNAQVT